jgi:hypothetical protein
MNDLLQQTALAEAYWSSVPKFFLEIYEQYDNQLVTLDLHFDEIS